MAIPMLDDEIMTLKEVCKFLKIHPSTMYKKLANGALPPEKIGAFRIGDDWRFRKSILMEWVETRSAG